MHPTAAPTTKQTKTTTTTTATTTATALLLVLVALAAGACAGENTEQVAEGAGFWWGLAHGVIAPFSFVVSLFRDDVAVYAVANRGGWYDFGFLLGVGAWHGGGHAGRTGWRRSRPRDAPKTITITVDDGPVSR